MENENKFKTAKQLYELNKDKKNKYALVFDYLKKDITDMVNKGMQLETIRNVLMVKLGGNINIKPPTLRTWIERNITKQPKSKEKKETKTAQKINEPKKEEKVEDKLERLKKQVEVF